MKEIFKTFYGSFVSDYLEDKIATFAQKKGYVEIARSAPSIAAASNGNFVIAVTSTFIPISTNCESTSDFKNELPLDTPIETLELSIRTLNLLITAGIYTLGDLLEIPKLFFENSAYRRRHRLPNGHFLNRFGNKAAAEVLHVLEEVK